MKRYCSILLALCLFAGASYATTDDFTDEDRKMFSEGQVLTKENLLVIAPKGVAVYDSENPIKFYSIRNEGDETIVTFSYSIYFDSQWVKFSKGTVIVDEETGDKYVTRGYTDGLTMDRLLIVQGANRQNVLISLRFPKLRKGVKRFSIYSYPHEDDLHPSNARVSTNPVRCYIHNAVLKDYLIKTKKRASKEYR